MIEKEPENYVNTLCISLVKEATLWSSYFDQNDHSLELQQKALDLSIKYNSPLISAKSAHNLAVLSLKTGISMMSSPIQNLAYIMVH